MKRQRDSRRLPNWLIGLVLVFVIAIASYLAFTKKLPWHHGYEIKAVFGSAQSIRAGLAGADRRRRTSARSPTSST